MKKLDRTFRLLCLAVPLPAVLLGAWLLAIDPRPWTLFVVMASTLASFAISIAIWRFVQSAIVEPLAQLDERIVTATDWQQIDSATLRLLARHIRERIAEERGSLTTQRSTLEARIDELETSGAELETARAELVARRADVVGADSRVITAIGECATRLLDGNDAAPRYLARLELLADESTGTRYAHDYAHSAAAREVVDRAVDAVAAIGHGTVIPVYGEGTDVLVRTNTAALTALTFNYLLSLPRAQGYLHVRRLGDYGLALFATAWQESAPTPRLLELTRQFEATMDAGLLEVPHLHFESVPYTRFAAGTVRVVAATEGERRAIAARVTAFGFEITESSESATVHVFAIDNDEEIGQLLDTTPTSAKIVLIGAATRYARANLVQLDYPLVHHEFEAALDAGTDAPRVLAIDDDSRGLALLGRQCRDFGIDVVPAVDAESALETAANAPFDAALVDINLPDGDGVELASRLRDLLGERAKVCILTAQVHANVRQRAERAGADAVFEKPLDVAGLAALLSDGAAPVPAAAPRSNAGERFDREQSLRLAHYRPEVAAELFAALISSLPGDTGDIEAALDNRDVERVRDLAHRLSGSLQYCGVPRLRSATRALEAAARHNTIDDVRLAFLVLKAETAALIDFYDPTTNYFQTSIVR